MVVLHRFLAPIIASTSAVSLRSAFVTCHYGSIRRNSFAWRTSLIGGSMSHTSARNDTSDHYPNTARRRADSEDSGDSDDSEKRINLPVLKYGYRTVPLSWEDLVDIITIQNDLAKLSRSIEQQKEYEIYKRDLLRESRTVTDHVLCNKFPDIFEKRFDAETKLWYSYPPLTDITSVAITLVKNDFPYYMEDGIEHWILWKLGESCDDQDIDEAKQELRKKNKFTEFLHWVNPPHLKSLPAVDHVHILGRLAN